MSVSLPNGSIIAIASGYGAAKTMSALTNAASAVATLEASHGVVVNDYVEITSGWQRINGRIARASAVATNDVTLSLIDTQSTSLFPPGSGTGSVREISGWSQIGQILEPTYNGGEQQFVNYQFLDDTSEKRVPSVKSAEGLTFFIADDPTLAIYSTLDTADQDKQVRACRVTLPSGAILLYNAYVSFNKNPSLTINQLMRVQVTLSFTAPVTRYTS